MQLGVAEAIEHLRRELGIAQDTGADQQIRFEVTEAEIELQVEMRKEAGGKLDLKVITTDAKATNASVHKLKLRLNVKDEALGGRRVEVSQERERAWDEEK